MDWLAKCIAGCLWNAHMTDDPYYNATPGLTEDESATAALHLWLIANGLE